MVYTYGGTKPQAHRKSWTRPKQRIRQEVYMQVRDPELLREIRVDELHMNQRQLATLAKCSQATISALETGKLTNISEDLGATLSRWLNRRPRELFDKFNEERVDALIVTTGNRLSRQRRAIPA
jgi:transcriptional regulator with XRE-family HTH domain